MDSFILLPVADLRGREGRAPPSWGPNSFNFMQFSGKYGKIVCWRPQRVGAPPRGNPGSATGYESDIAPRWVQGESSLMFTLSSDKWVLHKGTELEKLALLPTLYYQIFLVFFFICKAKLSEQFLVRTYTMSKGEPTKS